MRKIIRVYTVVTETGVQIFLSISSSLKYFDYLCQEVYGNTTQTNIR